MRNEKGKSSSVYTRDGRKRRKKRRNKGNNPEEELSEVKKLR